MMEKIIKLALLLWFLLAVFRIGPHLRRLIFEEPQWLKFTDSQKREIIFSDLGAFYNQVRQEIACPAKIIYLSPGSKARFLAYYYFYPCQVIIVKDVKVLKDIQGIDYFLALKSRDPGIGEVSSWQWDLEKIVKEKNILIRYGSKNSQGFLLKL